MIDNTVTQRIQQEIDEGYAGVSPMWLLRHGGTGTLADGRQV